MCPGHEVGFSIEKTVMEMDIPEENIFTLLCYMELMNRWGIKLLSNSYMKAKVISYGGPKYLKYEHFFHTYFSKKEQFDY